MRLPAPAFPLARVLALAACVVLAPRPASAQDLPGGAQLGMSAQALQQALPLRPVQRPARLAGGLVGRWSAPAFNLAGVAITPTYFLADGQLERVEYLADPASGAQAFDALRAWGRAAWGPELASQSPEGAYAAWSSDETDAYLQRTGTADAPVVRLVIKRRVVKDAGEL